MADIDLMARLEADLDESEAKQYAYKAHSSACTTQSYAPSEPQPTEITTSTGEGRRLQRKAHSSECNSQCNTTHELQRIKTVINDRDEKYSALEEQCQNVLAKELERGEDSETTRIVAGEPEKQQFSHAREARNGGLLQLDKDGSVGKGVVKGANDKRGFAEADLDDLQKSQALNRQHHSIATLTQNDEGLAEKQLRKVRKRARSPSPPAHCAPSEVGHEVSKMSGGSPGRKRKERQRSKEPNALQETADGPEVSPTLEGEALEIADSEDELFRKEGVVVESKWIKRNATVKQHLTETDTVKSAKTDKEYAHETHDDSRDPKDSHKSKDTTQKQPSWGARALKRFNSSANSLPDYEAPKGSHPVPVKGSGTSKMHIPGGPKPHNSLSRNSNNNSSHPPPRMNKRDGFDFLHGDYSGRPETPNKRQKMAGSRVGVEAHKQVIDLESQPSQKRETPSVRSFLSQTTQNGQQRDNRPVTGQRLQEFGAVEDTMRVIKNRRRNSGPLNAQTPKSVGQKQQVRPESKKQTIINYGDIMNVYDGEDPEDPISDLEGLGPEVLRKTRLKLAIPASSYKGTANRMLAREPDDRRRSGSTTTRKQTATTSPHFPPNQNGLKRRSSSISNSVAEVAQNGSDATSKKHRRENSAQRKSVSTFSKGRRASELSEDELGMDESQSREMAESLLAKRKEMNGSLNAANVQHLSEADSSYCEDERKADMVVTSLSKKRKQNQVPQDGQFQVIQVFTQREVWLFHGLDKPWLLRQDMGTGILNFFNEDGHLVPDLSLESKVFTQIQRNAENGKLVILKSADNTLKRAYQIYLELANKDESETFCKNVKSLVKPPFVIQSKSRSHFENTFTKVQSEIRKLQKREPEDIRIAKKNNEATVGAKLDKAQAAKERTPRLIDQLDKDEDPAPGNQKLVQGRNPRSSIDALSIELEELSRPTKTARLDDSNPHATRSRNATREFGPRELAKLRSASPERWTELHPDWAHNWESSIIYPNEGKHKATVDKQDIERLDEGKFLNDNLIMFYLLKLERDLAQRDPAMSKRVYFHNTFFYEALTTPVKGKRGINYEAVKRWTSRVNLLSYDYIIVPVNENSHWYLAIIYNAPKLVNPDPQVNEIPQSQETNTDARQSQSNTGSTKKVPPASPQNPSRISPSETSVGEHMRNMSLEEEEKERLDPSPMNALTVQTAPKQRNNLVDLSRSDPQPIRDRIAHEEAMTAATETSKQVAPTKRGKRKSLTPAPRKFSPKEPKIITLDSLGMAHSATCTNLRDYLIAEGKSKLDVEISAPRALGMTAVNIPQQKNCCDCGLFLLSYVKEFLGDPDEFTASLLEKLDMDVEHRFTTAPDLRNDIRELLFNLQMEQVAAKTEKNLAKQKGGKAKKPLKAHGGTSTPVESVSREQPKSAGPSTDADRPKSSRSSAQPELRERETAPEPSDRSQGMEHHTQKPASRTADLGGQERDTKGYDPETEPKLDITSKLATRNYINLNEGVDDSIHMPNSNERPSGLIGTIQGTLKNNKNSKSSELTQSGASRDTAFEVQDDSPHKCGHATHRVSDPDTRLQSDPEFPYPDSEQQLNPRRGRESTPYPETLRSVSPDVDETSIEDRNQRTPSPKDSQNPNSSPLEPAAKLPSPDSASDIVDMTGDESQTADDQEMLLSQHAVSVPPLLDNSSAPNTPIQPPKKQRTVASPQRSSSRKSSDPKAAQSPQSVSTRQRPEEFMAGRDSSDQHIVGKWKVGERKGIRTNFTL